MRLLLLVLAAPLLIAQPTYTTGFEPPTFVLGDVRGQNGWGHLDNSPTGGTIVATPVHGGVQALSIRTRNADFFGVASHLYSPTIDPAGESGSVVNGAVVANPNRDFAATLWYRAPDVPVVSTRSDGRIAELNPSSKGPNATDPTKRYAQVRIFNNGDGRVRVEIGWYTSGSSAFTVAVVGFLQWGAWYRFDYLMHFVDGLNGSAPNDRFTLTIFDANGALVGTACGSTWETGWKSDATFGGGLVAQAVNGFDFWSQSGPNGTIVGTIDDFSMTSFNAPPFTATISGATNVCFGATSTLSTPSAASTYLWRNAAGDTMATTPTFAAPAGTYTLTISNALCETATSAPFTVTQNAALQASISGRGYVAGPADRDLLNASFTGTPTSYTWRDSSGAAVGTGATFNAAAGTYTVTITDAACGSATSRAFAVVALATPTVPTLGEWALLALAATLALLALARTR